MRCTKKLSCREHENHDIMFCKASTHQGDVAAFNPSSVGRQCLPNCLIVCTMTAVQNHQLGLQILWITYSVKVTSYISILM